MTERMPSIRSFPPIATASAKLLILGSMPGEASLTAGQYYAHPHNLFWPIMTGILGLASEATYAQKAEALKGQGMALWDVLKSCHREGSLDSSIEESSIKPNDFNRFFREHTKIVQVYFNGGPAERLYRKYVLPVLKTPPKTLPLMRLPSTSPANASWSPQRKREAWSVIARYGAHARMSA